jgi:hypothetical protein
MLPTLRSGSIRVLRASVAPFLLLITPFIGYVQYQRYGLAHPEILLVLLLLAGVALLLGAASAWLWVVDVAVLAGLLTFFADIQAEGPGLKRLGLLFFALCVVAWLLRRHVHRIVSLMAITVLAFSVLPRRSEAVTPKRLAIEPPASAARADLPLVVHLLLDEFIGVEGLPTDLAPDGFKQKIRSFFVDRGFRLFGQAYSEYPITQWSVPHLLNLAPGHYQPDLTTHGPVEGTYKLKRNAYFERMARLGYAIKVREPDFLYLCPEGLPASCITYASRALTMLNRLDVSTSVKFTILSTTYLAHSETYTRATDAYRGARRRLAGKVPLPPWGWQMNTPAAASSLGVFDAVAHDLAEAQPGTFLFAHVLIPHYPYVYDADCVQRPATEWMARSDPSRANVAGGIANVPEGRAKRYAAYFQQVGCALKQVSRLMDAIPPSLRRDAIVIVQGDHGSRITLVDPTTIAPVKQATSDYADAFSTMFAVRSASIGAGYDLQRASITCLLRALAESDFRSTEGIDACSTPNTVFFQTGGKPPVRRPLPDFGDRAGQPTDVAIRETSQPPTTRAKS